ncbi:unnamed protein product [Diatraea saccharalis]|uniref:Solute carrier family 3 member 2 N-terminal domain-containing protein n=1 Tax=Diatraea saccharalis TaxID=40085 RepID=A0A9N9WEC3_9NEOP|nr:unnamed protein product [Diatraea saccharalis]
MDPERQPLLYNTDFRLRRLRPLTHEEVLNARNEVSWHRARFCLAFMFWAIMAMFLSIVVCILVTTPKCRSYDADLSLTPSVPPVHMSFAPLVASGRAAYNDLTYTT